MDVNSWLGVTALVLAVPLGIASNLLTPRIVSFFEKRKLIKDDQTREQALRVYRRIKAFHEGTRDRYSYYLLLASSAVICAVASSTLIILIVLIVPDINIRPGTWAVIPLILAVAFFLFTLLFLAGLYETSRQLERFDEYKAELKKRWGTIDEP